jgi:hypothetical protein
MKPAMSLVLILAVVTSTLPVSAQVQTEPTDGPIARAGAREVAHYAAQSTAAEGNWSQVLTIKPGTEITVRNREGQAAGAIIGKSIKHGRESKIIDRIP